MERRSPLTAVRSARSRRGQDNMIVFNFGRRRVRRRARRSKSGQCQRRSRATRIHITSYAEAQAMQNVGPYGSTRPEEIWRAT